METKTHSLSKDIVAKIAEHYFHSKEKHPFFAHELFLDGDSQEAADEMLRRMRKILATEKSEDKVHAETCLNCEIFEAIQAYASGDKAHAVEECYDTIAVLLRIIDAIEGREKLGR